MHIHPDTFDHFDRGEMFVVAAALVHDDLADLIRSGLGPATVEPGGIAHAALVWVLVGDDSDMSWWCVNRPGELARWLDCLEVCDAADHHADAARLVELQAARRAREILADALGHAATSVAAGADPVAVLAQIDTIRKAVAA